MRFAALACAVALTLAVSSCGFGKGDDSCGDPCVRPADALIGFPNVAREAGSGRVVSTMEVGQSNYICLYSDCDCVPAFAAERLSSDPAVASFSAGDGPATVCNDYLLRGANPPGTRDLTSGLLTALQPGEVQISMALSGPSLSKQVAHAVSCEVPGAASCVPIDVVRVVPRR